MHPETSSVKKTRRKGDTTVTLPASHVPVFPKKCVVCNKECNDSYANIEIMAGSGIGTFIFSFKKAASISVPTHAECRHKSMLYSIPVWVFMFSTGIITYWMKKEHILHGIKGPIILVGLCLLVVLVVSLYSRTKGMAVEKKHDNLKYSFVNPAYAREFAELNNTVVGK